MRSLRKFIAALFAGVAIGGCTVHPAGEAGERGAAMLAGAAYEPVVEARQLPVLSGEAAPEELATYALLANGEVERRYWEWRAALEQVPQEGTQKAALMLSFSSMITNGRLAWDTTTLGAGTDPANNLMLPGKLATSAAGALERARGAGLRFDQARFDLRARVLTLYNDYALAAEQARLDQANIDLLQMIQEVTQSRLATGGATQAQLIKAASEVELAKNDLAGRRATFPRQVAAINALLNRRAETAIAVPKALPPARPLNATDGELLQAAARDNAELQAQARELAADQDAVKRAKQEYIPDLGVNVGTDLQGMAQSLAASLMVPAVRYQAIDGAIRQAEANFRATDAARRQAAHDVASRIVGDLAALHDAQRQAELLDKIILPRLDQVVTATRKSYATGQATLLDLLDAQRSLIAIRRLAAQMKVERENQLLDIEGVMGRPLPAAGAMTAPGQ